jgi:hypothetical protein
MDGDFLCAQPRCHRNLHEVCAMTKISEPDFAPREWPDDYLMSRAEAAALSRALGMPIASKTLAKMFCVCSNGPLTRKFGRRARIRVGDFKRWLADRTSPARRSSSEGA